MVWQMDGWKVRQNRKIGGRDNEIDRWTDREGQMDRKENEIGRWIGRER